EPATGPGRILGTTPYMSPEQVQGKVLDHRSDVFALGIMLYEMATGERPFAGDTFADVASSILKDTPVSVTERRADLPRDLAKLIRHCLEKEPKKRFQSTLDLANQLEELRREVDSGGALTSGGAPVVTSRAGSGRRAWLVGGAVIAALAVAGGYYLLMVPPSESPPSGAASVERKRLVVLPFENLGASEDDYFAAGMTEEITSRLAGVRVLAVASGTTASEYDRSGKTLKTVGSELGVDYVLEGNVRWDRSHEGPGRVRITPRLIRAADDTSLWSATYEREMADVFALQSEVAEEVVRALGESLTPQDVSTFARVPTEDLTAYDLYLRAYRLTESSAAPENAEAIRLLSEAVQRDPSFAEAHAKLAQRYVFDYWFYRDRSPDCLERSRRAAERAVALAPDAPETHLALGWYYYMGHLDYERALEQTRIVLHVHPDDSDALFLQAMVHRRAGRLEETARLLERVLTVDPGSALKWSNLCDTYWFLRRYPEADRACARTLALNPRMGRVSSYRTAVCLCRGGSVAEARALLPKAPASDLLEADFVAQRLVELDFLERRYDQAISRVRSGDLEAFSSQYAYVPVPCVVGDALRLKGDPAGAREDYELALEQVQGELKQRPEDPRLFSALGLIHAGLGHREEALRAAQTGVDLMPISREAYRGTFRAEDLARVHALVGNPETAIDLLEDLLTRPSRLCVPLLRLDPAWDPLRDHPRFKKLVGEDWQAKASS
ncbi:MAG: tetratricopeptide repeat protein, partial [Acidobacteria bacterium]|nr:tetratricopeptide repeat protein [Acidobacteriota bacterium]